MSLRVLISLFTGICMLLIFAATPVARAYVQGGDLLVGKNSGRSAAPQPTLTTMVRNRSSIRQPETPWGGHPPGQRPRDDETSAPVPEPGTLTLASLGLLALGAAMRKRRTARALAAQAAQALAGGRSGW